MDSILLSTKKLCNGIDPDNKDFDDEIIMFINSVFMTLNQIGIGPIKVFRITDETTTWDEFLSEDDPYFETCKVYMGAKVKLQFDPPTNSTVMQSLVETIREYEWRLNAAAESQ